MISLTNKIIMKIFFLSYDLAKSILKPNQKIPKAESRYLGIKIGVTVNEMKMDVKNNTNKSEIP